MFYAILSGVVVLILATFLILRYVVFKENEKFKSDAHKILKITSIVYVCLMLVSVLLPDAYALSLSEEELSNENVSAFYSIVRWFSMVSFVAIPLAIYFKNRKIKNIAIYFCVTITILQVVCYQNYLADFTSTSGRGLNSISVISDGFKAFLINPTFRSIWFGLMLTLQIILPVAMSVMEKHVFDFKSKNEYINMLICLPLMILSVVPIYVPQHLFGYSNLIFEQYGLVHFGWMFAMIGVIVALYFVFRKKDENTKMLLLFVLSLSLIMQYNQMFSAISINLARLPLQLCNIGSFLILISLITRNKKIFNFTIIINVVGVLFAIAMPDLDGKGLFYLYNMHFIFEHSNVLIVPVLALLFGIFPRLDKSALKECLICFCIYFVIVWVLGTVFNAIAVAKANDFYSANYLFMFQPKVAIKLLPFTKALFDINFKIGYATFYPVLQLLIFIVFALVCVGLYYVIRLIYRIKDKIASRKNQTIADN